MRDLVAQRAPELLERVTELVGEDPFARVEENTRFAQPAIFCASRRRLGRAGSAPVGRLPATRSASSPRWSPPASSSATTRSGSSSCAAA